MHLLLTGEGCFACSQVSCLICLAVSRIMQKACLKEEPLTFWSSGFVLDRESSKSPSALVIFLSR